MAKKQSFIKAMKKVQREARLERERLVGKPRASSWGSKPTAKDLRRQKKFDEGLDG